jgi:hypothetical protein
VPKFGLTMTQPPAQEPVSLAELKGYLSIPATVTTDDAMLQGLIIGSRMEAEVRTMRQIVAANFRLSWDGFYQQNLLPRPGVMLSSLAGGLAGWADAWRVWMERGGGWGTMDIATIRCPGGRMFAVNSIVYYDDNGNQQTLAASLYQVDTDQEPGRIVPSFGNVWPTTRNILSAVQVNYTVGWAHTTSATAVAAPGTQAITVANPAAIQTGTVLSVDQGANQEWVSVSGITGSAVTATFAQAHTGPYTVTGVPEELRNAIKFRASMKFENRWTEIEDATFANMLSHYWTGEMG